MDDLFAGQPADPAFSAFDNLTLSENPGASNAAVPELPDFAPNGTHGDLGPGPAQQAAEKVAWTRTRWSQQPPLARLSAAGLAGKRLKLYSDAPIRPLLSPADTSRASLLALLTQMELLLRRESVLATLPNQATPENALALAEQIDSVLEKAESELESSGVQMSLTEWIDAHGLASLFPRSAERLGCNPVPRLGSGGLFPPRGGSASIFSSSRVGSGAFGSGAIPAQPMDLSSHLARMNLLNQAVALATQLYKDVNGLQNHKYLAHQVALLYQSLSLLSTTHPAPIFTHLQSRIRENFDVIKQQCSAKGLAFDGTDTEEAVGPVLSHELAEWLSGLCKDTLQSLLFEQHGRSRFPGDADGMVDALFS